MLSRIEGGAPARPTLFFKRGCPPCRCMSALVVLLSLGLVTRVPIDSDEARELYRRYPHQEGQLVLLERRRVTFGRRVFLAVPRVLLTSPVVLARLALRGRAGDPGAGR